MAESKKNRLSPAESADDRMRIMWFSFILVGAALCCILIFKVIAYKSDPVIEKYLTPRKEVKTIYPERGDILDYKNRILATSTFVYDVHFDTKAPKDTVWNNNIRALAEAMAAEIGGRSADQYLSWLQSERRKGSRYVLIGRNFSQTKINSIRTMPIFRKGRNAGGYLEDRSQVRLYPYGSLAYRTLGYVKNNSDIVTTRGIEGNFDNYLHGRNGRQLQQRSDDGMIPVADFDNRKAVNGLDVRTTLDIDIQNIADNALRRKVEENALIEKSCVIVMETKTGAIRAMVNLGRNSQGKVGEWDNYAVRTAETPGSVFKAAVIMALLEDGYITSLDEEVPTFGGVWKYKNLPDFNDTEHLNKHRFPSGKIKIWEAFRMSANNTFRQLVCDPDHYGENPQRFIDKIRSFGLLDSIAFDLKGVTKPFILEPEMKKIGLKGGWDGGTFPRMAIGYGMEISPLNLIAFYNAIANDGRMMKPYLVDAILDNGSVEERFKPEVMHDRICNKATTDTLKRAMKLVVSDPGGTAYWQFRGAACPVAGKTGTSQRTVRINGKNTIGGEFKSHQASFAGFFPADDPKYTAIVVVWSKPSHQNFYGASYSAPVFREIADKIYCLNED